MKVNIKRIDLSLPLPVYETSGSKGFDICARGDHVVAPGEIALVPSNLIVEVPDGYMLMIASRSSTPRKKGVMQPHGFGVIDSDYCGPSDEILIQLYNFLDRPVEISHGEKIAQGIFVRTDQLKWEESVDDLRKKSRGGFGSTGGYEENKVGTAGGCRQKGRISKKSRERVKSFS